ncbi:MAG: DUF1990 family protein [Saprospiraceae bacterium]
MIYFRLPKVEQVSLFLKNQAALPYTYAPVRQTAQAQERAVPHYDNDRLKLIIGSGEADFQRAKIAIQHWKMFPESWTRILPQHAPIQPDTTVAMHARFLGVWWRNACRIVYVVDEPERYGFAYGTLPGHVEAGEELFLVFKDEVGNVWYEIKAFSRPRHWLAKIGYPIIRLLQARFRRDSAVQMRAICNL